MMNATIRRKALAVCSSALGKNGGVQSLERVPPALAGSTSRGYVAGILMLEEFGQKTKLAPGFHQGAPGYSVALSCKVNFSVTEPAKIEKIVNTSVQRVHNGSAYFPASGAVFGSVLSTPVVNAPQATKLGLSSTVSSTFLPNLALFWHINNGIEEILADYVHHEMTRSLILVLMRLFLIVAAKDVFVATN
ncbi:hypothetical protein R6Q57_004170 [Mikania cordata]